MKYMLSIYVTHASLETIATTMHNEFEAAHLALQRDLAASGELVGTGEYSPDYAKLVRVSDGAADVTDGPFTEGASIVGGYYLVDCASGERALEIAARFVEAQFEPVEVRRLL